MSNLMQFERIFLTLYDPECEDEGPVWWIDERNDDSDIEYINADLYNAQAARIAELEALVVELEERLEQIIAPVEVGGGVVAYLRSRIAELEALVAEFRKTFLPFEWLPDTEPGYCWGCGGDRGFHEPGCRTEALLHPHTEGGDWNDGEDHDV